VCRTILATLVIEDVTAPRLAPLVTILITQLKNEICCTLINRRCFKGLYPPCILFVFRYHLPKDQYSLLGARRMFALWKIFYELLEPPKKLLPGNGGIPEG
jgi:hypothetical protein